MVRYHQDKERGLHRLSCLSCQGEKSYACFGDRHLDLDRFLEYWLSLCPHLLEAVENLLTSAGY